MLERDESGFSSRKLARRSRARQVARTWRTVSQGVRHSMKAFIGIAAGIVVLTVAACDSGKAGAGSVDEKPPTGKAFPTPQAAVEALERILGVRDKAAIEELFGAGATEVIWSGDDVADTASAMKVKTLIDE